MPKKKLGRPKGEKRTRVNIYIKPVVKRKIDAQIDGEMNSRGKVVESKFE